MSEPIRDGGAADQASARDLRALVQDLAQWRQAPVSNTSLVAVSIAAALPQAKRTPALIEALSGTIAKLAARVRARFYVATPNDFALMIRADENGLISAVRDLKIELLRLIEQNFPGSFGSIDQTRLVVVYDLIHNYRSAADRVTRYAQDLQRRDAEAENDGKLRPLTGSDIERVMAAYQKFGSERFIKAFVRSQPSAVQAPGHPFRVFMTEFFISMDLLRKPLFIDVEMRGSGRLFSEFTLMLDQIMLEAFPQIAPLDGECSLNINVQSVFTPAFEQFLQRTPREKMSNVVFEFRQANIVEHFDEFQVARGLIKERDGRIAVDQIFPQTVGLVDIDYLGASVAKIHWRQGAEEILLERRRALKYMMDCGVQPILIRVDDPRAVDVGHEVGITAFQGFLIDTRLKDQPAA